MPTLDSSMIDRGPIPGSVNIPLMAAEDADENMVLTWGATDGTVALADATDEVLGWSAGSLVEDQMASVYPANTAGWWKCLLASGSADVSYGDVIELADSGEVSKAVYGSGNTILGKAMSDGSAGGYVLVMPMVCCPSAQSS